MAAGIAEDVGAVIAQEPDARVGQSIQGVRVDAFGGQHGALRGRPTRPVFAHVPVGAHDPVTGDQRRAMGCGPWWSRPPAPPVGGRSPVPTQEYGRTSPHGISIVLRSAAPANHVRPARSSGSSGWYSPPQLRLDLAGEAVGQPLDTRDLSAGAERGIQLEASGIARPLHERHAGGTPGDVQRTDGSLRALPRNRVVIIGRPRAYRSRKPSPRGSRSSTTNV